MDEGQDEEGCVSEAYDEYPEYPPCPSCGRIGAVAMDEDGSVVCKCGEVLRYGGE